MTMANPTIHIVLAGDGRSAEGIAVAAHSAIRCADRPVFVTVIEDGIRAQTQKRMIDAWRPLPHFAGAHFAPLKSLPLPFPSSWSHGRWPLSSCSRFQVAAVLPKDAMRCIYLDYDTVTGADLGVLIDLDMQGSSIGMVPNFRMSDEVRSYVATLGIEPDRYCNAGVLLIDVDAWRRDDIAAQLIDHGKAMPPSIWFFDQDMLNSFFRDSCLIMDERWNMRDAAAPATGNILHFAGSRKPWQITRDEALIGERAWIDERATFDFVPQKVTAFDKLSFKLTGLRAKAQRVLMRAFS